MLKKATYILLASLLIISTMGFVILRHYCDETLVSVAIDVQADKCCDCPNADCCHDEGEYIILITNFVQPAVEQLNIGVVDVFNMETCSVLIESTSEKVFSCQIFNFVPIPGKHNLLSKIQSFLC